MLVLALVTGALWGALAGTASAQSGTRCVATFTVVHNDRVGRLSLPAGFYQLRTNELTCTKASFLFREFLSDFNGVLPRPWRVTVQGTGIGTFVRGSTRQRFQAVRVGNAASALQNPQSGDPNEGGGHHGTLVCPGSFRVLNNDSIGELALRAGRYRITRMGSRITCGQASNYFRQFLNYPSGRLPGGWVVLADAGEFVRGSSHYGFRVKPYVR